MGNREVIEKREKVASIIQEARVQKDLTQSALAKKVGYSRLTIVRIENGGFSPNADQLYKLCEALELTISIGGEPI